MYSPRRQIRRRLVRAIENDDNFKSDIELARVTHSIFEREQGALQITRLIVQVQDNRNIKMRDFRRVNVGSNLRSLLINWDATQALELFFQDLPACRKSGTAK